MNRVLVGVVVVALGCGGSTEPRHGAPALASLVGDPLAGVVATQITVNVLVTDTASRPVPNQLVNFVVASGGGSVFAGSALTDGSGQAKEIWTLGTAAGEQTLEARAVNNATGAPIVLGQFKATARAGEFGGFQGSGSRYILWYLGAPFTIADVFAALNVTPADAYNNLDPTDVAFRWYGGTLSASATANYQQIGRYGLRYGSGSDSLSVTIVDDLSRKRWRAQYACTSGSRSFDVTTDSVSRIARPVGAFGPTSLNVRFYFRGTVTTGTSIRDTVYTSPTIPQRPDSLTVRAESGSDMTAVRQADGSYRGGSLCPSGQAGSGLILSPLS